MSTRGIQDISYDMSVDVDNSTISISKWYLLTNSLVNRERLTIINQGVNQDLTTGTAYISLGNSNVTETVSITNKKVIVLGAGDSISGQYGNDIKVNVQCDTVNMKVNIEEIDSIHGFSGQDT